MHMATCLKLTSTAYTDTVQVFSQGFISGLFADGNAIVFDKEGMCYKVQEASLKLKFHSLWDIHGKWKCFEI